MPVAVILVVEDDRRIGRQVADALTRDGHEVTWSTTGRGALSAVRQAAPDLVLLDLGLPDLDGLLVCRKLRALHPNCVIVMVTARKDEIDVIVGLESGGDDYLTKPFSLVVLLARVRAHLRRLQAGPGDQQLYRFGDLEIDLPHRSCSLAGNPVRLRAKEFDLLARLAREVDRVVSREDLMADVWDERWHGPTKTLDVHVAMLRRRLAEAAAQAGPGVVVPTITTLRGHGYRLDRVPAATSPGVPGVPGVPGAPSGT